MSDNIGYVVIEYNQASHQPAIVGELHPSSEDAAEYAEAMHKASRESGRRETYAIGTIYIEEG